MAVWVKLQNVVSESEIESIPETTGTKIEDHLCHLHQLIEDLKNENSELTAVSERQQFQFEKEMFDSHNQLIESSESCVKLKTTVSELEESLNTNQKELRELRQAHDAATLEFESTKRRNELLLQEKQQLVEQLEKRKNDTERLNESLKKIVDESTAANEKLHAAVAKAEEAQMRESNFQHQVNRLEQEKSLLEKQINDLNVELAQKNHEIHVLKREKSTVVLDLQSHLEHRVDEVHLLEKQVHMLKDSTDKKDGRIETLAEKIRTLNETSRLTEEQFNLEISAQGKLVDLFKKASEDNQNRVTELVSAFEEAQKLLQELSEARNAAEQRGESAENQFKAQIQELTNENLKLNEELKHANDLCHGKVLSSENLESFFPAAAATSKVLRSGMTLTQLYSEYVKAQEEMQNLQSENTKLNDQLKHIIGEIEENTPVINQKMKEYHKSLETISCLRTQLASSLTDYEKLQSERNDAKRIAGQLERENKRLKLQVQDLNRQIQTLLKEIEERRGSFVKSGVARGNYDQNVSSSDDVTADKVISRHLVTFRDIMDIQTKNQQLLAVVRQLSEDQELQEQKRTEEKTAVLQKELQGALTQLEELQQNRMKQAELVESIVRQRDMYRVLLTHQGFSESLLGSPQGASGLNVSMVSPGGIADNTTKTALQQLQAEFDNYKKEKAENERMLNEQLDKLRSESSDLRIEHAKLTSQIEYSEERVGILKTNMENFKKEAMFLREKNQKGSGLITQHQQTIQNLQQEMMDAQEKLAKASVALESVRSERDMLKNIEKRLLHEKESLFREQQQKSQVLANLQAFQNNLERIESESKRNLQYQVDKYEKENTILKAKLESANEDYKSAVAVWEKQNKEKQLKIDAEVDKNRKLHEDLIDTYSKFHTINQELSHAKASSSTSSGTTTPASNLSDGRVVPNATPIGSPQNVGELKKMKEQLQESQARSKALQEQLEITRKASDHYQKIANDLELHVKEQNEINCQLKESMEANLTNSAGARTSLEESLESMEKSNRTLIEDNMKLTQEKDARIQELLAQIASMEKEYLLNKEKAAAAEKVAAQAREDCLTQMKIMEETQDKYERELVLHADGVRNLTILKEEHQKCQDMITQLRNTCQNADQTLQDLRTSWTEKEQLLLKEHEYLNERTKELETQNNNLLHELELIGTQVKAAMQSKTWTDAPKESLAVDLKDTDHLLQIIQFVKKEKEIINTQFDSMQSENTRLKLKIDQLTAEWNEAKNELRELQQTTQAKAVSDSQHAELLRKIEMMNLLTESNSLLRIEKENLIKGKAELETKLSDLHKQIQPLQDSTKEINLQLEIFSAENLALRQEVVSWKSRTNQLLEQSHRIGPQEYKNMTRELEELRTQKVRLADELQRKQTDFSQASSALLSAKKELEILKGDYSKRLQDYQKLTADNTELQKTMLQVKKIGRKYKTQYDELKVTHDLATASMKAQQETNQEQVLQELKKELEKEQTKNKELQDTVQTQNEAIAKKDKDAELINVRAVEKQEKTHKLLTQARQKMQQLTNQKFSLSKELEVVRNEMNSLKSASGDENTQMSAMKSECDAKIAIMEAELKSLKETNDSLKKQCEDLSQKVAQQQKQTSKPQTVIGIVERVSGSSEPLTANIKPLSAPTQPSSSGLRIAPHVVSQAPRSTPTASIRPMAIGAASSSQARMAAVLPTTSVTMVASSDEDAGVGVSAVPQAAVQPTPAMATVAPTTVAPIIVISEVVHSSSDQSQISIVPVETTPNIFVAPPSFSTVPATAMVSPRIEITEVADTVPVPVESHAPTLTVIVSPPTTQTQLVTPTVKRKKDDSSVSSDVPDGTSSAPKRVRMISEGSQTNQQSTASHSGSLTVVPVATVLSRPKGEIPTSEVAPSIHVEAPVASSSAPPAVVTSSSSALVAELSPTDDKSQLSNADDVEEDDNVEVVVVDNDESVDENIDWDQDGKAAVEGFDAVIMVVDEESGEQMEGFDEDSEHIPDFTAQSVEDEDMGDDTVEDSEEMGDQTAEFPNVVSVQEESSDTQMEADTSSLQTPPTEQCMAPPASPMTQGTEQVETVPEPVVSQARRPPQIRRFPGSRQDRLPSTSRQHLTPFTIQGQAPSFEEGDDSIVPSTPTLFVPRRTDGFAEAISSPHVPSGRFLFNSSENSPNQQGFSQLASQGALGMDDTRMDLSQFDEGGGNRTVPSTSVLITLVSPPDESAAAEVPEVSLPEQPSELVIPLIVVGPFAQDVTEQVEVPQPSSATDCDPSSCSSQSVSADGDGKSESKEAEETEVTSKELEIGDGEPSAQAPPPQSNVRKPIVWTEETTSAPSSTTPTASISSTSTLSVTPSQGPFSPPPAGSPSSSRAIRVRRMRYRGSSVPRANTSTWTRASEPRGRGAERRSRGTARRSRMF